MESDVVFENILVSSEKANFWYSLTGFYEEILIAIENANHESSPLYVSSELQLGVYAYLWVIAYFVCIILICTSLSRYF